MRNAAMLLSTGLMFVLAFFAVVTVSGMEAEEADLAGTTYEINRGANGDIFVSNIGAGEIWHIGASGAYTVYEEVWGVRDAKPDADGDIWFTDYVQGFGRVDVSSQTVVTWTLTGAQNLGGVAFDDGGNVWLSQVFGMDVYRFDPVSTQVCTYTLPTGSYGEYIAYDDGYLWLASWSSGRIYRLDGVANRYVWWEIEGGSAWPMGLDMDEEGGLWWADIGLDRLARLDLTTNVMTTYDPPEGTAPQMIAIRADGVWYTEYTDGEGGTFGLLRPDEATGSSIELFRTSLNVITPECSASGLAPSGEAPAVTRSGSLSWEAVDYVPVVDANGWTVYPVPTGTAQGGPYGIADSGGFLWIGDQGREKLLRFAANGQLGLVKSVSSPTAFHGDSVEYTYEVTYSSNDGSPAQEVVVIDDMCSPVVGPAAGDDANGNGLLDADETWTYTCEYTVPAYADGEANPIVNVATVSANDIGGVAVASAEDSASLTILHQEGTLAVQKSGPATAYHEEVVTFTYAISYSSSDGSPAQSIVVSDDVCEPVTGPDATGDANGNGLLDVDETWVYECEYTVPPHQEGEPEPLIITNTAQASGEDLDGDPVTPGTDQHDTEIVHEEQYWVLLPLVLRGY